MIKDKGGGNVKFLTVNESKLKIVLEKEDAKKYGVDYDASDSGGNRKAFFDILAEAKREVGFDTSDDKVLIQFYPTADGGCEIFVTKLGIISSGAAEAINRSHKVTVLSRSLDYFSVGDLTSLIALCKAIRRIREPISDVYRTDRGSFYLAVESHNSSSGLGEFPFITEFASRVKRDYGNYIREHFEKISARRAVSYFADEEHRCDI